MRGILQMGLRPKPPAFACGDPFAPRRSRRGALCAPWGGRVPGRASGAATNAGMPLVAAAPAPVGTVTRGRRMICSVSGFSAASRVKFLPGLRMDSAATA